MNVLPPLSPSHSRPPRNRTARWRDVGLDARVRAMRVAVGLAELALEVQVVIGASNSTRWRTRLPAPNHGCIQRAPPPTRLVVPRDTVSTPE
jgi:hypothetical protein